jgi:condensin complex subunit 3
MRSDAQFSASLFAHKLCLSDILLGRFSRGRDFGGKMLSRAKAVGKPKNKSGGKKDGGSDGIKIKEALFHLFSESQYHISSHRKNVHALLNLQRTWCKVESEAAAAAKGFDSVEEAMAHQEEEFFLAFVAALGVVLGAKRMDESVGRLMRFVVGFIVFSAEKTDDAAAVVGGESSGTVASRFIENLMLFALEGVDVKEKLVRARLCQVIVACVNSVDELSDAVWQVFRAKMMERLFDKEAVVRVQAVHAMARLQALPLTEDESSSAGLEILDVFMDLLQHDPSAEVRKTVLGQIDVTPRSLGVIRARRRDVDPKIRRSFYAAKLGEIDIHNLTIEQRDQVLRSGLTDRYAL